MNRVLWCAVVGFTAASRLSAQDPSLRVTLSGHTEPVYSVTFSPDGKTLASGSEDASVRLWDVTSGGSIATFQEHSSRVLYVSFEPDGKVLKSFSRDMLKVWDGATDKRIATLRVRTLGVNCETFVPGGHDSDANDEALDRLTRRTLGDVGEKSPVEETYRRAVITTSSADGKMAARVDHHGRINVENRITHKTNALEAHLIFRVYSLAFSPDGKTLAAASEDKTIKLWDAVMLRRTSILTGHLAEVYSVAFSPKGKILASGSGDKTVRLWDVATGKKTGTLAGHAGGILCVKFSPDGKTLASGSTDGEIKLWTLETDKGADD